jgi:SAM-dependent methyltransferase
MSHRPFNFKHIDEEGEETLDAISKADLFNEWMYKTILPHCKGRILEIGSGIGNISSQFLNDGYQITLSDIREYYCDKLATKFGDHPNLEDILILDLIDPEFETKFSHLFGTFDTVFALNVVEHIFDDKLALSNIMKLLTKGGHAVILVPAYQFLFNGFDVSLEHYRRYTVKSLKNIFHHNQYHIRHSQYFNFIGIFGWFVSGKLQKNKTIPESQMGLYNKLVPIFKFFDKVMLNKMGLSAIVVGAKTQ